MKRPSGLAWVAAHKGSGGNETCKIAQMFERAYTATHAKPPRYRQVFFVFRFFFQLSQSN
jgi:hypothetical protein